MTTTSRRHVCGVVLAALALAGFGDGRAQGTGGPDSHGAARRPEPPSLQLQLFEATRRTNELAVAQNRQTQQILEQTNALAEASVKQSAEAEQVRQMAEASIAQNQQALQDMRPLVERTLQQAEARRAFTEKVLLFWSAVLALFIVLSGYLHWRERRKLRAEVMQSLDEIRRLGLGELQKVVADLQLEKQALIDDAVRQLQA